MGRVVVRFANPARGSNRGWAISNSGEGDARRSRSTTKRRGLRPADHRASSSSSESSLIVAESTSSGSTDDRPKPQILGWSKGQSKQGRRGARLPPSRSQREGRTRLCESGEGAFIALVLLPARRGEGARRFGRADEGCLSCPSINDFQRAYAFCLHRTKS
jgi:hypothetical protein